MKTRVACLLVTASLLVATAAVAGFQREMTIQADVLRVADLIGAVAVSASPDAAFHVKVAVRGKDATPELVKVEQDDGEVRVVFPVEKYRRYVYPDLCCDKASFYRGMSQDQDSWWRRILDTAGGKRIQVRRHGRGLRAWADLTVLVPAGKRLEVVNGAGSVVCDDLDARITCEQRHGPVTVTGLSGAFHGGTGNGDVTCKNIRGDLHLETGSGKIKATGCRGEHLHADTGSGDVILRDVDVSLLEVDTGSGDVAGEDVGADEARLETGSGDVQVAFSRMGEDWFRVETGSGDVDLRLPAAFAGTITAETGSGDLSWELPGVRVADKDRRSVRLVLGEGETRLKVEAGSGDIRLRR